MLRCKFNTRDQRSDENIDQFVTELRRLANDCSYADLLEEMIRDRIVCGTNNPRIKEKLLQDEDLSLIKVIMTVNKPDENNNCDHLLEEFSDVLKGRGCLSHEYHIKLKPGVKPVVHAVKKNLSA